MKPATDPVFFETQSDFRDWLKENHNKVKELWVGFYKKDSGRGGITYPEALDEALCMGWIDGIRKRVDDESFTNRFTPRKKGSIWSNVNIKRVGELQEMGRMQPPGLKAFNERKEDKSGVYSFEQTDRMLEPAQEEQFRANKEAWAFWEAQPPGYRRTASWWVISAKREETRQKRLEILIEDSRQGRRLAQIAYDSKRYADS